MMIKTENSVVENIPTKQKTIKKGKEEMETPTFLIKP